MKNITADETPEAIPIVIALFPEEWAGEGFGDGGAEDDEVEIDGVEDDESEDDEVEAVTCEVGMDLRHSELGKRLLALALGGVFVWVRERKKSMDDGAWEVWLRHNMNHSRT